MNSKVRIALRVFLLAFGLLIAAAGGFIIWLTSGSRSIPFLSYYIQQSAEEIDPGIKIAMGSNIVKWSGFNAPLSLTVTNLKLEDQEKSLEVNVPELRLGIDPLSLILGSLRLKNIGIKSPKIIVSLAKLNESKSDGNSPPLLGRLQKNYEDLPFKKITIENAEIIDAESNQTYASIEYAEAEFLHHRNEISLLTQIQATIAEKPFSALLRASFLENGGINIDGEFTGINPANFKDFLPENLSGINIAFGGKMNATLDSGFGIQRIQIETSANNGEFQFGQLFPEKIPVSDLKITLNASENFTKLTLSNFYLGLGEAKITAENMQINYPSFENAEIKGHIDFANIDVATLLEIWPLEPYSKNARDWVRDSLSGGKIEKGAADIAINPGDLPLKALPEDSIHGEMQITGMAVNYSPKLSPLKNVSGLVKIGGNSLAMDVAGGTSENSVIDKASAVISDLAADAPVVKIAGNVHGKAEDLNQFIALEQAEKPLMITAGDAETSFSIELPLLENLLVRDIKISADAKLSELAIPKIYDDVNLSAGNIEVKYNNEGLLAEGEAALDGSVAKLKYEEQYNGNKTVTGIDVDGAFPKPEISKIIGNDLEYLSGIVPLVLHIKIENGQDINAKADLKDVEVKLPEFGYQKAKGKDLSLALTISGDSKKSQGKLILAGDVTAAADIGFGNNYEIDSATIHGLKFGKNDLEVKYNLLAKDKYHVSITGKSLDASPVFEEKDTENNKTSYRIDAKIPQVYLKNGESLKNVEASLDCLPEYCAAVKINGLQKTGAYSVEIKPDENNPQNSLMQVHADDAGAIFDGAGISPHMRGGTLDYKSYITRNHNNSLNEGTMTVQNFSIIHGPILAKIATLASFSGIVDTLNGDGIFFKKMIVNFAKANDLLKIKDSKAYGPALGLTADGFVDVKKSEINLQGAVVPSYTVNSILGNIPVIGNALQGGEGTGIIAANYKVTGSIANPDVTVNPLSLLTPGFLRGLFDILDEKADEPKIENKNAPAELIPEAKPAEQ